MHDPLSKVIARCETLTRKVIRLEEKIRELEERIDNLEKENSQRKAGYPGYD